MNIIAILAILVFGAVVSYIEVPKMLKEKSYRDLWTFSILLVFGMILGILKSLNVNIPNPSDWVAWVYSPASEALKAFLEQK